MSNFLDYAREHQDEYLADLRSLIQAVSVKEPSSRPDAPFGPGVRKALDTMLAIGKRDGFETEDIDGYAGVIRYGQGDQSVGVLGHLDVVPLGKGWTKKPDDLTLEDGIVYGRGVLDDKGPLLAAYYGLRMIRDAGIPLDKEVRIIAGTDEESGMECMKYYRKHGRIPDLGFTPDAEFPLIYAEKGHVLVKISYDGKTCIRQFESDPPINVVISEASALVDERNLDREAFERFCADHEVTGTIEREGEDIRLTVKGRAAHASVPWLGINAAIVLLEYIADQYKDNLARLLFSLLEDWHGKALGISVDGRMGPLTLNTGYMEKKEDVFETWLDIRYPEEITPEQIVRNIEKNLKEYDPLFRVELENSEHPLYVDPNSKLVRDLMESYQTYTGDMESKPMAIGGGTYAKCFDNFVAFGPAKEDKILEGVGGCHEADEGIALDDLLEAAAIYADAIVRLAGK